MNSNLNHTFSMSRTGFALKRLLMVTFLTLLASFAALAQQTVFYDSFASSTINGGPTTNMIPGGTPTASYTSYEIASGKNATATTNSPGNLSVITAATSSGNTEAQALFTKYPVTLATVGDYIELEATFTDTTNVLNGLGGNQTGPLMGLYNSGGIPPLAGTLLWNGGLGSATTAATGGTKNWLGYIAGMYHGLSAASAWTIAGRPAETAVANNTCQELLYGVPGALGTVSATPASFPFPTLTCGLQYTAQLRIILSAAGTLTVSNALFAGVGTGGAVVFTNTAIYTGANFLTTNFDGLAVGARPGGGGVPWTNNFNSITVIASLAAQAGPYYLVTSSGAPCAGGLTIGLSGSVTTNVYLLYTNGIYTGQSVLGTGSAISFGFQSSPATYTVIASNTVTASEGPMLGSAGVFVGVPVITSEPASVVSVTNQSVSFSATVTGNGLTYQWYRNAVALTNGGDFSGVQTTNLVISPAQAADAATSANGYYIVATDACGNTVTSTPVASLTFVPPNSLVWQGNNNSGIWDLTNTFNFLNQFSASAQFTNGDIVTFDDSSPNTSVNIASTNLIPTLTRVIGSQSYNFSGSGQLTGFGQLLDGSSGTLTIGNANTYTGGTIVSNSATLQLGTGSGIIGSVGGTVNISSSGTLQYNYSGTANANGNPGETLRETLAGSGTVNYNDQNGAIIATASALISSNFNGTINIQGYTCVHAVDLNSGYPLGNGSTINVPANTQAWLDRATTTYNNTFNIAGTGWLGSTPQYGALRTYVITINGPINLLANARIGGSSTGPTIQSVVSGNYQLEIYGLTNTFVATMGPTNGSLQAYASTLITSGSIIAANSNAISAGPLALDSGGDLRLNGYNIAVSNLSSINSGAIQLIEGPRVRNMNSTNSATLTVGSDGTSTEFDGTFSDGTNAPFGLTKVGAGTLTLTLLSSNTGPVTVTGGTIALSGSGSFNKAPIAIGSGAFFDVSSIGGTLTLNANQKLMGNGTLTGTLAALAGSIVAPGLPMGTLTVSGSATINGTYQPNLNRTNAINCSKFTASGGVTFGGATLSDTNIGPRLQVGDAFQLFPGATAGFSTAQLQTNDVPNNAKYTWNNTVSSDGKITVATVASIVNTNPTNIVTSVSGGNLTLSWPTDHTGFTLQSQTNSLSVGLATNWVNVAGSTTTNQVVIPINAANGAVFYRLKF
jgi:hypothetical protein